MYLSCDTKFHDNESTHILHNFWTSTHRGGLPLFPLAAPLLLAIERAALNQMPFVQSAVSPAGCMFCFCAAQPKVGLYIGWRNVTESMVTIRSPFCGYNTISCVELNGEDLSCYSYETESVSLRKCPYQHWLTSKAYLSAVTVTNIYQSFYLQVGGENRVA